MASSDPDLAIARQVDHTRPDMGSVRPFEQGDLGCNDAPEIQRHGLRREPEQHDASTRSSRGFRERDRLRLPDGLDHDFEHRRKQLGMATVNGFPGA